MESLNAYFVITKDPVKVHECVDHFARACFEYDSFPNDIVFAESRSKAIYLFWKNCPDLDGFTDHSYRARKLGVDVQGRLEGVLNDVNDPLWGQVE